MSERRVGNALGGFAPRSIGASLNNGARPSNSTERPRSTEPLNKDRGTRPLGAGSQHLMSAYGDPKTLLENVIKGVSTSQKGSKVALAVAGAFIAKEELAGVPIGKALTALSSHLKTLGDAGNAVRGVISTAALIGELDKLKKDPGLIKDPTFLLNLGYNLAGSMGGAMVDLKYADKALSAKGVFAGGQMFKLMGKGGKLKGVVRVGEDGAKVYGEHGELIDEVSGDFSKVKDLAGLKDLGVVTDATKAISTSALGEFVGKAAPGLGIAFGALGTAKDIQAFLKTGKMDLKTGLDLGSNVLQTVGSVALFLPPPADAVGGAMLLASAGVQIGELAVKHWGQIEHVASAAAHDVENAGGAVVRGVAKEAGAVGKAVGGAWHAVTSWF